MHLVESVPPRTRSQAGTPNRFPALAVDDNGPRSEIPETCEAIRVLIADDNAVNRKVATRMLQKLGCEIDVVSNGREAVEMIQNRPFDIVFMDCQMPEMDGFQATALIRERHPSRARVPIVAMTANAMIGDREVYLSAGIDDYVSKPLSVEALRDVLTRWAPKTRTSPRPKGFDGLRTDPSNSNSSARGEGQEKRSA